MNQAQERLLHNFPWLFLFCLTWLIVAFGWLYYRHKKIGIVFPEIDPGSIWFEERGASGCSHETLFSRLGGAKNCLRVTVTDAEVWIRPSFPFNIFGYMSDLEHRIAKSSITRIEPARSVFGHLLKLDYKDEHGRVHQLSLALRKQDDFLKAVDVKLDKA